jgi:hypothetical protein
MAPAVAGAKKGHNDRYQPNHMAKRHVAAGD